MTFCFQSQTFQEHGLTQAQRALVLTIDDGLSAVNQAQTELDRKIDLPDLGSDAVSSQVPGMKLQGNLWDLGQRL